MASKIEMTPFEESLLQELGTIKRLLVASLASKGVTQAQLAALLQTSQPTISRMLPRGMGRTPQGGDGHE